MSIENKHILWNKYEKNPTTENKNIYTNFRNKLTGLMRKMKGFTWRTNLTFFKIKWANLGKF